MSTQFYLAVSKDGNTLFQTQPVMFKGQAKSAYQHLTGRLPHTEGYTVSVHELDSTTRDVTADFR